MKPEDVKKLPFNRFCCGGDDVDSDSKMIEFLSREGKSDADS